MNATTDQTSDREEAFAILRTMVTVDLFDYLADHVDEPTNEGHQRHHAVMLTAVLLDLLRIGPAIFCQRMRA